MNRRDMLKRVIGVGAVAASAPLLSRVLAADEGTTAMPGPSPAWEPPPLDTRTPDQVYDDSVNMEAQRHLHNIMNPQPRYSLYPDSISWDAMDRLQDMLEQRGLPRLYIRCFGNRRIGVVINGGPVLLYV